ncbi:uncharacterized protein [Globicephala melas]|uniref:uncharacterized protein n=1 Tax=Globicephala melas TaxID=9731 RepID=UPI00293D6F53|nr:uncharacterized protein LOC132596973 [Globicephala melas]
MWGMIVTGQTASGTTGSLAVTREGTRKRQAGGTGGAVGGTGSSGPREPDVNGSAGLEQNPPSLACGLKLAGSSFNKLNRKNRLHVSRLDAVPGSAAACDCGLDSRELSLGSQRGALGCAPGRQASSLRELGPRCFAHGRGGRSGLWSVSVRTYTWLLLLSVALQAGFKEKGRHAGPTGGRCLWNKSAWTCPFQGAVVSWRPSSGKRQKRARAWAPGPPRKAAAAQAKAPSTSVLGLPGAGQAERRRGPKSCARAARGRCGPRLPPRPHRGGPGAVPGHRRAAGFPTCLLPRRFDSGKKDNNPGAFQ